MFITIIIALILFSYIFGKILPYLLKWFITRKLNQMGQDGNSTFRGFSSFGGFTPPKDPTQNSNQKEGEIHINHNNSQKKVKDGVGEYVDYEEIKN